MLDLALSIPAVAGAGGPRVPEIIQSIPLVGASGITVEENGDGRLLVTNTNGTSAYANSAGSATAALVGNFHLELEIVSGSAFVGFDDAAIVFGNTANSWSGSAQDDPSGIYLHHGGDYVGPPYARGGIVHIDRIGDSVRFLRGNDYATATVLRTLTSQSTADMYFGAVAFASGTSMIVRGHNL